MRDLTAEYQTLLVAEESSTSLDKAIAFALNVASGAPPRWFDLIKNDGIPKAKPEPNSSSDSRRVHKVAWLLSNLPRRAEEQEGHIPESQYSLLTDALLLVFQQAYFALLPSASHGRKKLLESFMSFSNALPGAADQFRVKGLVQIAERDTESALESFNAAVAATPSDAHDFLTRVQMLWTLLMEDRRYTEAYRFLDEISPRVTRIDFDEFRQLQLTTFEEASR